MYHGESGVRPLRELSRSYLAVSKDLTRVMNRLKAIYRSWAIPCADGSLRSLLAWLSRIDVLVIDDWAMAPLAETPGDVAPGPRINHAHLTHN